MKKKSRLSNLYLIIVGLGALIWFLIRVVPKPSRATYPCQRVAFPIASAFVIYIVSFVSSSFAFLKFKKHWGNGNHLAAIMFLIITSISASFLLQSDKPYTYAGYRSVLEDPNEPIGVGKGIFPGRVVWVFDRDATNENCIPNQYGNGWFLSENNDQSTIDKMLSDGLQKLTDQTTDSAAWQAIFSFYNENKGKGAVGYSNTEKIFIKTNATSSWSGNFNTSDLSVVNNSNYGMSETSPQIVLAVLRQLVNVVGVPQDKIYIGDPMKHIYKHCYDMWHSEFTDVHYMDYSYSTLGREKFTASTSAKIYYSDRGAKLRTGNFSDAYAGSPVTQDYLYTIFDEAEYILNIPMLKGHRRAGVTMFAKNHFGSNTRSSAVHLHCGLPAPNQMENGVTEPGYGKYRVTVDLMGHELTGGKNLLYLMDALWSSDQANSYPKKFFMEPFNNDWMSSIFLSLDPVAIESVGYDFLRSEFTLSRPSGDGAGTYVQMDGVDDYLHQAASSSNWPTGIQYDPENDGTVIGSLGTHEHWNNPVGKLYSRNLGAGDGIELVQLVGTVELKAKIFLEGPYLGSNAMNTELNTGPDEFLMNNALLQPYNVAPINYNGEESVGSTFFASNTAIVDWVLVELRSGETPSTAITVSKRAAFIVSDGNIVDLDGISPVKFNGAAGDYYIVIKHRNHLAIMSAGIVSLPNGTTYDFTIGSGQFYGGSSGAKELETGVWGMIAGDGNCNGQVQNNDSEDIWKPENGTSGYKYSDFNMNGQVQNDDNENYWKPNNGRGTQVPAVTESIAKPSKQISKNRIKNLR